MNWAYKQTVGSPNAKSVLVSLANQADQDGKCWPSIEYLAKRTELHRSTVIRQIEFLETKNFISKTVRPGEGEGRKSNVYFLHIEAKSQSATKGQSRTVHRQSRTVLPKQSINNQLKEGDKSPPEEKIDPIKEMFDAGVSLLTKNGMAERPARMLVGQLRKAAGEKDAMRAIREARSKTDPETWLRACCHHPVKLPTDSKELWEIRKACGLTPFYDNLKDCHAEINAKLRANPELRAAL